MTTSKQSNEPVTDALGDSSVLRDLGRYTVTAAAFVGLDPAVTSADPDADDAKPASFQRLPTTEQVRSSDRTS